MRGPLLSLLVLSLAACLEDVTRKTGPSLIDGGNLSLIDGLLLSDSGVPVPRADLALMPDLRGSDAGVPVLPDKGMPPASGDYDFTKHINFTTIPSTGGSCNQAQYGEFYCDVWLHTKGPYTQADTMTNIHESQHFMAHEHDSSTPAADKFIYYRGGKGAFYPEPKLTTSGIASSILKQGLTYNTYITSRPSQALGENIVDEWRAYLTEEIVAIQMAALKGQKSVSGLVIGGVEYLYYNAAALHALKTKEPAYLTSNPQAVAIFAMLAEEVKVWTIDKGVTTGLFDGAAGAQATLTALRTDGAHQGIRDTLKSLYGAVWTARVLGFN